jgi:hypothetical protein
MYLPRYSDKLSRGHGPMPSWTRYFGVRLPHCDAWHQVGDGGARPTSQIFNAAQRRWRQDACLRVKLGRAQPHVGGGVQTCLCKVTLTFGTHSPSTHPRPNHCNRLERRCISHHLLASCGIVCPANWGTFNLSTPKNLPFMQPSFVGIDAAGPCVDGKVRGPVGC